MFRAFFPGRTILHGPRHHWTRTSESTRSLLHRALRVARERLHPFLAPKRRRQSLGDNAATRAICRLCQRILARRRVCPGETFGDRRLALRDFYPPKRHPCRRDDVGPFVPLDRPRMFWLTL